MVLKLTHRNIDIEISAIATKKKTYQYTYQIDDPLEVDYNSATINVLMIFGIMYKQCGFL